MKNNKKISSTWLITYEAQSDRYKKLDNKILAILKYQKSVDQIEDIVCQLYVSNVLSPVEQLGYLKYRQQEGLPYKTILKYKGKKTNVRIGHNPTIYARKVKNLRYVVNKKGEEKLLWDEFQKA